MPAIFPINFLPVTVICESLRTVIDNSDIPIFNNFDYISHFSLTVQLSRDLEKDFVVYFPQFFQLLVGLLDVQDVELLEQLFTALAYLFKYLWRYLVKDIQQVYG